MAPPEHQNVVILRVFEVLFWVLEHIFEKVEGIGRSTARLNQGRVSLGLFPQVVKILFLLGW